MYNVIKNFDESFLGFNVMEVKNMMLLNKSNGLYDKFDILYLPLVVKFKEYMLSNYSVEYTIDCYKDARDCWADITFVEYLEMDLGQDILMHFGMDGNTDEDLFISYLPQNEVRLAKHLMDLIKELGVDYLNHLVFKSGYFSEVLDMALKSSVCVA